MTVKAIPDGYHTVTPYLLVTDVAAEIEFLQAALGAVTIRSSCNQQGDVLHGEVQIGDSKVMLGQGQEQWPAMPCMLYVYVEDVDTSFQRAVQAGAEVIAEPADMFYGDRHGGVKDPAGNQWWLATHIEDVSDEEIARRQLEQ